MQLRYKYNNITGAYWCYDARENLPEPCPEGFYGENCYEIEWKVRGQTYEHSICEDCKLTLHVELESGCITI
jgi:hypothetical protein